MSEHLWCLLAALVACLYFGVIGYGLGGRDEVRRLLLEQMRRGNGAP